MMSTKHARLHDDRRPDPIEQVDGLREISFEEMGAVSGGTDIKALARMAAQSKVGTTKARGQCTTQILLTCLDVL
jgi:hypothetical protein